MEDPMKTIVMAIAIGLPLLIFLIWYRNKR